MKRRTMCTMFSSMMPVLLLAASAGAQMTGSPAAGQQGMPPMAAMPGQGMMPGGMMPGMMGPGSMMGQGGMMPGMMGGGVMPSIMGGMMPGHVKGCMDLSVRMMMGSADLEQMRKNLGLSDDQVNKLQAIQRPLQKESIKAFSAIRIAELDLADLLSADQVDLGKVEAKLKEIEAARTGLALNHFRAAEEVKKILTKEQLATYGSMCQPAPAQQAPQPQPKP